MTTIKNNPPVDIYMFYPNLGKLEKKGNFNRFFANLNDIDEKLNDCVIFLNLKSAMQYSRFMHTHHVTLKAQVPQHAINGNGYGLCLKKGFLTKEQVAGCFPSWAKGTLYLENPEFNFVTMN